MVSAASSLQMNNSKFTSTLKDTLKRIRVCVEFRSGMHFCIPANGDSWFIKNLTKSPTIYFHKKRARGNEKNSLSLRFRLANHESLHM